MGETSECYRGRERERETRLNAFLSSSFVKVDGYRHQPHDVAASEDLSHLSNEGTRKVKVRLQMRKVWDIINVAIAILNVLIILSFPCT